MWLDGPWQPFLMETNNWTDLLFKAAQDVGIPELQRSLGLNKATERQLVNEQNYYNRLNGSGAPDPNAARDSASNETELNNPNKFAWGDAIQKAFKPSNLPILFLMFGLLLVVMILLKRR